MGANNALWIWYIFYDPILARSDYVGKAERSPTIHNRGALHTQKPPHMMKM